MQTIFTPYKGIVVITILVLAEIMQSLPSDNSVRNITIRFLKIDSNNTSYSSICQTANLVIKLIFSTVSKYIIKLSLSSTPILATFQEGSGWGKWWGVWLYFARMTRLHIPQKGKVWWFFFLFVHRILEVCYWLHDLKQTAFICPRVRPPPVHNNLKQAMPRRSEKKKIHCVRPDANRGGRVAWRWNALLSPQQ